jgi:hypothetical protein
VRDGPSIPSLDALGDRLEAAASRSIAGSTPARRPGRARPRVLVPALVAFLALVVVASVVLAGSRSGSGTADAEVTAAMKRSSALSTGHFRLTLMLKDPAGAELRADGAYDAEADIMHATLDASDLLGASTTASTGRPVTGQMVVDHGTIYLSIAGLDGWFRVPGSSPTVPVAPSSASGIAGDPSGLLDLAGGVEGVERVGPQDLDGVATTHYRTSVDLGRAFADLAPDARHRLAGSLGMVGGGLPRAGLMPVDVWVDDAGMVRRIDSTVDLDSLGLGSLGLGSPGLDSLGVPSAASAVPSSAQFSVEFSDLGSPVAVTVPDPSTVSDFPPLPGTSEPVGSGATTTTS